MTGETKRVAILQSMYIPWKGYFDLMATVDEFVLLDDVQYTPRNWRNRNRIKTDLGPRWLTIPVRTRGRRNQKTCEARVADPLWARRHWQTIVLFYRKAPCFRRSAQRVCSRTRWSCFSATTAGQPGN